MSTTTAVNIQDTIPLLSVAAQSLKEKIERNDKIIAAVAVQKDQAQDNSKALQSQIDNNDATIKMTEKKLQEIETKNQRIKVVLGLLVTGVVVVIGVIGITKLLKP